MAREDGDQHERLQRKVRILNPELLGDTYDTHQVVQQAIHGIEHPVPDQGHHDAADLCRQVIRRLEEGLDPARQREEQPGKPQGDDDPTEDGHAGEDGGVDERALPDWVLHGRGEVVQADECRALPRPVFQTQHEGADERIEQKDSEEYRRRQNEQIGPGVVTLKVAQLLRQPRQRWLRGWLYHARVTNGCLCHGTPCSRKAAVLALTARPEGAGPEPETCYDDFASRIFWPSPAILLSASSGAIFPRSTA